MTTAWWPFIEACRGRAGRPAWHRAAPPAALLAPRQSLSRSFAGMSAPVGDDGTRAKEGYLAALMRPASLSPPVKGVGLLPLLLMHSKTLIPDAPDQTKETGVGGPTLWPFFYAM